MTEKVYFLTYNNFSDDLKSRFTEAFNKSGGFPNMSKLLRHMYIMYSQELTWIESWYEGWVKYRDMYQVTKTVTAEYGRYLDKFMCNLVDYYKDGYELIPHDVRTSGLLPKSLYDAYLERRRVKLVDN